MESFWSKNDVESDLFGNFIIVDRTVTVHVDRKFKKITLVSKKMDRIASNWSRKVHEVIFCWFRYDSIERSLLRGRFDEKRSLRICGTTNKVHEVRRGGVSSFDSQRHFREKHDFRLGKTRTAILCFLSENHLNPL